MRVIYLPITIAGSKKMQKNGIDDQNGFYLFYASCPFR